MVAETHREQRTAMRPCSEREAPPPNCQFGRLSQLRGQQLQALVDITAVLSSDAQQKDKLEQVLLVLDEAFGLQRGTIMLLAPEGNELRVEALRDQPANEARTSYKRGEGITGQVLELGIPVVIEDIREEPDFIGRIHDRQLAKADEALAFICVPIKVGAHETIGTLAVDRPVSCPLPASEVQAVLLIVATLIAHELHLLHEHQQEQAHLALENRRLRAALGERLMPANMVGTSGRMRIVYEQIATVAASPATVLIRGESGTGKELVASAVHYASERKEGPFVRVNCAALNENLLESELFGHEKGAFTGAVQRRIGRIEEANGGTLFLDEIGEFSQTTQVKLLRMLQEREYERVGSNETRAADVRIVAATNRDLEEAVQAGEFRQDLYYRINVFPIRLPPLRERREDILALANHFMQKHGERLRKRVIRISTPAIDMLMAYHWPGNVRELENCIEFALLTCREGVIHGGDMPPTLQMPDRERGPEEAVGLSERVEQLECEMITDSLKRNNGVMAATARELGVTARILRYKVGKLGIRV